MSFIQFIQPVLWSGFHGIIIEVGFNPDAFDASLYQTTGVHYPFALQKSSYKRQAEFLAGRIAAQAALAQYGLPTQYHSVGINLHHAPCWPKGIIGSISHHNKAAYAVVADTGQYSEIGMDAEPYMSAEVAENTWNLIIHPEEKTLLNHPLLLPEQLVTLIFSAKESLYKALHPSVEKYFDFLDACMLSIDFNQHTFILKLSTTLNSQFVKNRQFKGHFLLKANEVITLIAVSNA